MGNMMATKKPTLYPAHEDNIVTGDNITIDSADNVPEDFKDGMDDLEDVLAPGAKPFEWHGVEFPVWAQGPHFIRLHTQGTFCLAIDPACVTMEMKANWTRKYVPILVNLGQQVLEKLLKQPVGHS